ncbi:MAG: hypothetical protein P1P76_11285 [Anaerolineales bacterium]|nr:hypothetical protein [Anaerolineales bacterium]
MKKQTLALIHWNQGEREQRAKELRRAGYDVLDDLPAGSGILRTIEEANPSAIIIDLTRIPSRGRDLGIAFRKGKVRGCSR